MLTLIRQLFRFWLVILLAMGGSYLLLFNQERIYVNLQGLGQFRVVSAVAFLVCFGLGASVVTLYFAGDLLRKSMELRRLKKRIQYLEDQLRELGNDPTPKRRAWFGKKTDETTSGHPMNEAISDRKEMF